MSKTLYNNSNINYTEWFGYFKEHCADNGIDFSQYNEDSTEFHNWVYNTLEMDWDDFKINLKYDKENNVDCVVTGSLGLWYGTRDINAKHFPTLQEAINACITGCDYITITEEDGTIFVKASHHDGTNQFEIHKLNAKGYDAHCETDNDLNNPKYFDKFKIEW